MVNIHGCHMTKNISCSGWCHGYFSSFCMGEFSGVTLFVGLEYSASLFDVVYLEGTQYPHFWGCWEICRFFEVVASWDFAWVVSYLGFYTMYFRFWFHEICFCFYLIFLVLCSSSWTCTFFNENIYYLWKKKKEKSKLLN